MRAFYFIYPHTFEIQTIVIEFIIVFKNFQQYEKRQRQAQLGGLAQTKKNGKDLRKRG